MARGDWRRLDESDVRVRPGKGTRPRSKRRPEHADAVPAMVVGVDRGGNGAALKENGADVVVTDLAQLLDDR